MADAVQYDFVITGAGPAGQAQSVLEDPPQDGCDIALTHSSEKIMGDLGMWAHIPVEETGMIRDAKVLNGRSPFALHFDTKKLVKNIWVVLSYQLFLFWVYFFH